MYFNILLLLQSFLVIYCQQNVSLSRYSRVEAQFCSFFNNRASLAQPSLKNCTWFRENSCCLQHEIDVTFSRVKPLVGASADCQRFTNYLMCYICAPDQNVFYRKERLTVCESFCNELYNACKFAILKGNQIYKLYGSGRDFCLSRRFLVGQDSCFSVQSEFYEPVASNAHYFFSLRNILTLYASLYCIFLINLSFCFISLALNDKQAGSVIGLTKVFLFFCLLLCLAPKSNAHFLELKDIQDLSKGLSSFVIKYANKVLDCPDYDTILKENQPKKVDGTTIMREIESSLGTFFGDRKKSVKQLVLGLSETHRDFMTDVAGNESYVPMRFSLTTDDEEEEEDDDDENNGKIFPPNQSMRNPDDMKWLLRKSSYKLSKGAEDGQQDISATVEWTRELDQLVNELNDPFAKTAYFASSNGLLRVYPGQGWKAFEPRVQPWYLGVKEAPSIVILILDVSYTEDLKKFERAKNIALTLLGSLAHHQRVAVIASSSQAWLKDGTQHNGTASVLGCVKDRPIRATYGNQKMLMDEVRAIQSSGGSDHSMAFYKAFEMLKKQQTSHVKYIDCRTVILFVTDGEQDEDHLRCSSGYHFYTEGNMKVYQQGKICQYSTDRLLEGIQWQQRNLPGAKAKIFTFLTSQSKRSDALFPGQLACQNNGALSRVYSDKDLFGQMSPFYDFIRAREYSLQPILTGPYESPFDGSPVITISAPVSILGSNRISGVVGMDIPFAVIESLLEEYHEYMFMLNLVDGSAIVHPLIKKSYEDAQAWYDVPVMDLEMEDSNHSSEFPDIVRMMMQKVAKHLMVVSKDASEGVEVEEGHTLWRPVPSLTYFFTDIPGTHYGVAVKTIANSTNVKAKLFDKPNYPTPLVGSVTPGKSYLHTLISTESSEDGLLSELNITTDFVPYKGMPVSLIHSTVILAPSAFCQSSYAHAQFHSSKYDIQDLIDKFPGKSSDADDVNRGEKERCVLTKRARDDILLSYKLEEHWMKQNISEIMATSKTLISLYSASISGVIRHYPGLRVPESYIKHTLRYEWFVRAILHPGKIILVSNSASFSGAQEVVTMSMTLNTASKVVLAADLTSMELKEEIRRSVDTSGICCPPSPHPANVTCHASCYLISDQGEIVMSLSDSLDQSRSRSLRQQFPLVYKALYKHRIVQLLKTMELKKNCSADGISQVKKQHITTKESPKPGRACMLIKQVPHINQTSLDRIGGTFGRSSDGTIDDDPCYKGMFFISSVNGTNLFLLTMLDYQEIQSKVCHSENEHLQKTFDPQRVPLCPAHESYYLSRTNSTTCPRKRFISIYCRYSSSSGQSFTSAAFFMSVLLTLVSVICSIKCVL